MAGGARVIRPLREADAESYVELRRRGLLEAPLSFGASPEDDMAASAEVVRDRLRQGPEWAILGAFQDGLIGAVGLMRDRYVKASHKAHVWGMYVAPGQRGCGVGAELLQAALQHARGLPGVSWVHLAVTSAAPQARRLYERAGFEVWGTEPEALRYEGRAVVEYHLALPLGREVGFRDLREGDIEEIFDVRGATRENAISRDRLAALGITPASVAEHLAAGATRGWVCVTEARIVGFCIAESATGEVIVLAVLPAFEGRGIGKTLLSRAVDWLRSFRPPRIWLGASSDPTTRSHGFYRALGWRSVGQRDTHGDEVLELPSPGD
jgi:ribosomal protein S18 acetylase RimI-like enzyme